MNDTGKNDTGKIALLPGSAASLDVVMAHIRSKHPGVTRGVVALVDDKGGIHTVFHCTEQEMARIGVRLMYLCDHNPEE